MKDKIIYTVAFVFVFALITGLLMYMSSAYKNVFNLDFSPPNQAAVADTTQAVQEPVAAQKPDSAAAKAAQQDSTKQNSAPVKPDSTSAAVKDTAAAAAGRKLASADKKNPETAPPTVSKEKNIAKRDSVYKSWVKSTGKLYETMDSKKAAKIIQGYSDNIARDLLLVMKKKKAAEIIAEFKPDVATRIISAQQ